MSRHHRKYTNRCWGYWTYSFSSHFSSNFVRSTSLCMSYLFLNIYLLLKTGYFRPTRWPYRHLEITFWFYTSLLCCLCLAKVQGSTLLRITHALWVFGVLWNIFIVLLSKTNPEFWMLILSFSIFRFKIEYLSLSHSIRDVPYHSTILIYIVTLETSFLLFY